MGGALSVAGVLGATYAALTVSNPVLLVLTESVDGEFDDINVILRGLVTVVFSKIFAPGLWPWSLALAAVQVTLGLDMLPSMDVPHAEHAEHVAFGISALLMLCYFFFTSDESVESLESHNEKLLQKSISKSRRSPTRSPRTPRRNDPLTIDSSDDEASPSPSPAKSPVRSFTPQTGQRARSKADFIKPRRAPASVARPTVAQPTRRVDSPMKQSSLSASGGGGALARARELARQEQERRTQARIDALRKAGH